MPHARSKTGTILGARRVAMFMNVAEPLRGSIELLRPTNAIAAGVLTFIGTLVAGAPLSQPAAAAMIATVLATGAGMGINDYFDREIDAINRPDRPIPRGAISPRWALLFSGLLFAIAVLLALTLPLIAIGIAMINLVALITYTEFFKGLPGLGNALVAFLGGSTFLFGGAAVGNPEDTIVLFLLAAFATLGREIIKDVEDIRGDQSEGLRTLPIVVGRNRALWFAAGCLIIAAVASPMPYLRGTFGGAYLVIVLPAIVVMLLGMGRSWTDPGAGQRYVKIGMYVAIGAFVVGRLSPIG